MPLSLKLVPRGDARLTGEIQPAGGPLRIGRDPQCEVVLSDPSVSRQHARLLWEGAELIVEDLGSSRGTRVNGVPVQRCSLKAGDIVRFGHSAEYEVEGDVLSTLQQAVWQSGDGEVRRLQLLLDVARSLNTATVLDEVLDSVLQAALRLTGADRALLCLSRDGEPETWITYPRGVEPAAPPAAALLEQALRKGTTAVGDDAAATPLIVAYRPFELDRQASFIGRVEIIGGLLVERSRGRRGFTPEDLAVFQSLAADAATAIDSARLYREAREKAKMDHELSLARTIQARLLRPPPPVPFAEVHAFSRPALSVGGDLHHSALRADGSLALALGDVSGKGMSAALLMAVIQGLLELLHDLGQPLSGLLPLLDGQLRRHNPGNRFLTLAVAFLQEDGQVEIANAGHCPVALLRRAGGIELVQSHGPLLGVLPRSSWGSERLAMHPGDALVFYSDGILESMDPEGNELGLEGIEAALRPLAGSAPADIAEALLRAAESHRQGAEAQDDVTLLIARLR